MDQNQPIRKLERPSLKHLAPGGILKTIEAHLEGRPSHLDYSRTHYSMYLAEQLAVSAAFSVGTAYGLVELVQKFF